MEHSPAKSDSGIQAELAQLRIELARQKEAARQKEGENFLLNLQVQQFEQQKKLASQDAQNTLALLGQVASLLDGGGGRVPFKGEVDRARAIVQSARKGLRRLAGTAAAGHGSPPASSPVSNLPIVAKLRASMPGAEVDPMATAPAVLSAKNHDYASAAMPQTSARRSTSKDHGRGSSPGPVITAGSSKSARSSSLGRDMPGPFEAIPNGSQTARVHRVPSAGMVGLEHNGAAKAVNSHDAESKQLQQQFLRQRGLLMASLRKSAEIEARFTTISDDLIRRDVIIHGLRQEKLVQQQEAQAHQQNFEMQMQQMQQQFELQNLQYVAQIQELQVRLQQLRHDSFGPRRTRGSSDSPGFPYADDAQLDIQRVASPIAQYPEELDSPL